MCCPASFCSISALGGQQRQSAGSSRADTAFAIALLPSHFHLASKPPELGAGALSTCLHLELQQCTAQPDSMFTAHNSMFPSQCHLSGHLPGQSGLWAFCSPPPLSHRGPEMWDGTTPCTPCSVSTTGRVLQSNIYASRKHFT